MGPKELLVADEHVVICSWVGNDRNLEQIPPREDAPEEVLCSREMTDTRISTHLWDFETSDLPHLGYWTCPSLGLTSPWLRDVAPTLHLPCLGYWTSSWKFMGPCTYLPWLWDLAPTLHLPCLGYCPHLGPCTYLALILFLEPVCLGLRFLCTLHLTCLNLFLGPECLGLGVLCALGLGVLCAMSHGNPGSPATTHGRCEPQLAPRAAASC